MRRFLRAAVAVLLAALLIETLAHCVQIRRLARRVAILEMRADCLEHGEVFSGWYTPVGGWDEP